MLHGYLLQQDRTLTTNQMVMDALLVSNNNKTLTKFKVTRRTSMYVRMGEPTESLTNFS